MGNKQRRTEKSQKMKIRNRECKKDNKRDKGAKDPFTPSLLCKKK